MVTLLKASRLPLYLAVAAVLAGFWQWRQLSLSAQGPAGTVLLTRGSVYVDPQKDRDLQGMLLVIDGVVSVLAQGSRLPAGTLPLEAKSVLLPAWADAHTYLGLAGTAPDEAVASDPGNALAAQRAAGVGLLADLNLDRSGIRQALQARPEGLRLLFAGPLYSSLGSWHPPGFSPWERAQVILTDVADLEAAWAEHVRSRNALVFASVEHEGREGLAMPLETLQRLGQLAHLSGLPFLLHAQGCAKARLGLEAGPDAIVGPIIDAEGLTELAAAMLALHCRYIPSLSAALNATYPPEGWLPRGEPLPLERWCRVWQRCGLRLDTALSVPRRLAEAGVTLAFGSGSGLPYVPHGLGVQSELAHLRRAGFSTRQVLAMSQETRRLLRGPDAASDGFMRVKLKDWDEATWDGKASPLEPLR